MTDTSDTETVSSVGFAGKIVPCPWDEIQTTSRDALKLDDIDERSLMDKVQTEYWWVREAHLKIGPDKNSNLKATWLPSSSSARQMESRVELSEYQVVRECLWALLGANKSFLFTCYTDFEVLTKNICVYAHKAACLTHITYGALDAFCIEIAKSCTCVLQIRAFTDFVLLAAPGSVPLSFTHLAESCAILNQDTFRAIASVEEDAKMPSTPPLTLISLINRLHLWFRRLSFVSALLLQICSPQLIMIKSRAISVLLLNRLEELSSTLSDHFSDSYLVDLINDAYVSATEAYLSNLLSLSDMNNRPYITPFLRHNFDIPPSHPMFWESGIVLDEIYVPQILLPIINDIVVGVKSQALLKACAFSFRTPKIPIVCEFKQPSAKSSFNSSDEKVESMVDFDPLCDSELHELAKAMHSIALRKPSHNLLLPTPAKRKTCPVRTLRRLREDVRLVSKQISAHLCSCLLQGPLALTGRLESYSTCDDLSLIYAFSCLADVALFRAGDRMLAFCMSLFLLHPIERTEAEVNGILKEQIALICGEKSWFYERVRVSFESVSGVTGGDAIARGNAFILWVDIPWPLNLILTKDKIEVYQRVFKFLLTLKHAKWALDSAKWTHNACNHKLTILRSRFLYVINGIHAFIADHIESAHAKFMQEMAQPGNDCNLDTLTTSLTQYLTRISQLCLLEDCASQRILNQALREIFGLCMQFHRSHVAEEYLAGEFSTRVAFLRTMLSEAMMESGRRQDDIPLLQILETAHNYNTAMQTRLHFNR